MDRISTFLDGIGGSRLARPVLTYLAAAWLTVQVVEVLSDAFQWTPAVLRSTALLLALGLPLTLLASLGLGARLRAGTPRHGRPSMAARTLLLLAIGCLTGIAGAGLAGVGVTGDPPAPEAAAEREGGRRGLAVLPFRSLGGDDAGRTFADGIHEEVLTMLSGIEDLRVTPRRSVLPYGEETERDAAAIAAALGVDALLEGSVRRDGSRVRVSMRLVDVHTRNYLWAESYDRRLEDVLALQHDVALRVAAALEATLTPGERSRLGRRASADARAYEAYLEGREYLRRPGYHLYDLSRAERAFRAAVERDTAFAAAHANLATVHQILYRFGFDRSSERRDLAVRTTERAVELDPELPEARLARGYLLYHFEDDFGGALREFETARRALPSDAAPLAAIAFIRRRQGMWDEALALLREAARLDPLNPDYHLARGTTLRALHRYEEAEQAYRRMAAAEPTDGTAEVQRGLLFIQWRGETDTLRKVLERAAPEALSERSRAFAEYRLAMYEGRFPDAVGVLETSPVHSFDGGDRVRPRELFEAWAREALGERDRALELYEEARIHLERRAAERPEDARLHAALGLAYAGLGWKELALEAADRAVSLEPPSRNAMYAAGYAVDRAAVLARVGEADAAVAELARLARAPGGPSPHELRLDPRWAPLRDRPDFRRLAAAPPVGAAARGAGQGAAAAGDARAAGGRVAAPPG